MIAGFGGELISHAFVEQELLPAVRRDEELAAFERDLSRWWRRASRSLGPASSPRSVHDVAVGPLLQLLGHDRPAFAPHPLGYCGVIPESGVLCLTLPWAAPIRGSWRAASIAGLSARTTWAIVSNGQKLRIIDCTRTWTRKGIEFDLASAAANPKTAAALWRIAQAPALSSQPAPSLRTLVERSDAFAIRVCSSLGDGVLAALPQLASALLAGRSAPVSGALDQGLTVVYRILFLLFAEARGMVPVWHELYRDAYSVEALAQRAMRGEARGMWAALRAVSRLAHAGCKAGDLDVTAFNGRLFSPRHAPLIEQRRVPDTVAAEVLLALATERTPSGRRSISYHDLGVEQLGSVYERVLEYEPVPSGRAIRLSRTSTERKATGSFYTPRSITEFLVRRTLAPLAEGKSADQILALRVVDPAMGSGAFLVAACRYLADQCELAYVRDGRWFAGEIGHGERGDLRRRIAEACLFGVDLNPTAVQLARLSLWLTTMAGDRPLTFLDHHLAAGNSLLGARLADLARPIRTSRAPQRDRALPLLDDQLTDAVAHHILPARLQMASMPSNSIESVRIKERLLADLLAPEGAIAKWSAAADAWCAAGLSIRERPSPGLVAECIAAALGAPTTLPAARLDGWLRDARTLAAGHGAFHWQLAFPEVFFDVNGQLRPDSGFDAVIGNPPWDMLRADTGTAADRASARSGTTEALRFYRDSGTYRLQGRGHANRYQLFLERALQLTRPGGRLGMILPSGIATDLGSAALRHHLFDRTSIDTWCGFDNTDRIFPIHRSMRFVVISTTNAGQTGTLAFRCGLTDPQVLDADAAAPALTLSRSRLEAWSPDLCVPATPDATALAILCGVSSRVPRLGDADGWHVRFGRELNATDDRRHFVPLAARGRMLPIVEGKQLAPFQIDLGRSACGIPPAAAGRLLERRPFERSRLAYRDVASATNKLTLIAAMLPAGTVSTHTVFVSKRPLDDGSQWCLLGLLNSLVANYLVRLCVTTHVTTATMARLPVPRPAADSAAFAELARLSEMLASKGIDDGPDEYARLNAIAAIEYGLTRDQFAYVTGTFPLIDAAVRVRALDHFTSLDRSVLPRLQ
jgi:hypothetical protein